MELHNNYDEAAEFLASITSRRLYLDEFYDFSDIYVGFTLFKLGNANADVGDYSKQTSLLERALPMLESYHHAIAQRMWVTGTLFLSSFLDEFPP